MNVTDLMRRTVGFHRDRLCTIHGERRITFGEQWERACRQANALIAAEILSYFPRGLFEYLKLSSSRMTSGRVPAIPCSSRNAVSH